jgi:hypothetical protein
MNGDLRTTMSVAAASRFSPLTCIRFVYGQTIAMQDTKAVYGQQRLVVMVLEHQLIIYGYLFVGVVGGSLEPNVRTRRLHARDCNNLSLLPWLSHSVRYSAFSWRASVGTAMKARQGGGTETTTTVASAVMMGAGTEI